MTSKDNKKSISLQALAELLNMNRSTLGKALKNDMSISSKTKQRSLAGAKKYGYTKHLQSAPYSGNTTSRVNKLQEYNTHYKRESLEYFVNVYFLKYLGGDADSICMYAKAITPKKLRAYMESDEGLKLASQIANPVAKNKIYYESKVCQTDRHNIHWARKSIKDFILKSLGKYETLTASYFLNALDFHLDHHQKALAELEDDGAIIKEQRHRGNLYMLANTNKRGKKKHPDADRIPKHLQFESGLSDEDRIFLESGRKLFPGGMRREEKIRHAKGLIAIQAEVARVGLLTRDHIEAIIKKHTGFTKLSSVQYKRFYSLLSLNTVSVGLIEDTTYAETAVKDLLTEYRKRSGARKYSLLKKYQSKAGSVLLPADDIRNNFKNGRYDY